MLDGLYDHQKEWVEDDNRIRFVTASRKTGKTRTFGREAFFDALETGRAQNFLSASKRQAGLFRNEIKKMSQLEFGIKLKGTDQIILETSKGPVPLNFLTPSIIYSQGFTGNLYIDEAAWLRNFEEVMKVAKPIASQKGYQTTYLTTASSMGHGAYAVKEGIDRDGNRKPKDDQGNVLRSDGRKLISVHETTLPEAIEKGYDLFDWEDIKDEYSEDEIKQLFLCQWIDERLTYFRMSELEACWLPEDELTSMLNPANPVWFGYDPSRSRDSSSFSGIEVVPDLKQYRRFFNERYFNKPARHQATKVKTRLEEFVTSEFLGIDTSGFGVSVYDDLHELKYPPRVNVKPFVYSNALKDTLVLNVKRLVERKQFRYSETDTRLTTAFLSIKRATTQSGGNITFVANRTAESGHADDFFSTAHALWPALTEHKKKVKRSLVAKSGRIAIA